MNRRRKVVSFLLTLVLMLSLSGSALANTQESKLLEGKVIIMHTNDSHGRAVSDDYNGYLGFSSLSALKKQYEAQGAEVILLDAGDTLHGLPFATLDEGLSIVKLMNMAGYDAMVPGNHDFNYGTSRLIELSKSMEFSLLSANFVNGTTNEKVFDDYTIISKGGKTFGIFGLSTPETSYKTNPVNVKGYEFENPLETAKAMVTALEEEKVDYIIALGHIGVDGSTEITSEEIIEAVPGIDVFVDGHSHTTFAEGKQIGDTLLVSTGDYIKNVGVVTIENTGDMSATLVPYKDAATLKDQEVDALIDKINGENASILNTVVGKVSVDLDGARETNRVQETNLGNLTADAMKVMTGADAAFENGGGIRASIPAGEITKGQVIEVFPFGNYVVTLKVKGAIIREMLEVSVASAPALSGGFLQVSGITFTYDQTKEAGNRVTQVKIDGKKLKDNKTYVIAMNNFTAAGGDNYTMLADIPILNEYSALEEVFALYLEQYPDVIPKVEGRIEVITEIPEVTEEVEEEKEQTGETEEKEEIVENESGEVTDEKVEEAQEPTTYTVVKGDCLWKIAYKLYGKGSKWTLIYDANQDTLTSPDRLQIGQILLIP